MKGIILLFVFFTYINLTAQSYSVKGQIAGSVDKKPLIGATVLLVSLPDSASRKGDVTDLKGRFTIEGLKKNSRYLLTVTFIGFDKYTQQIEIRNKSLDLGMIFLTPTSIQTNEIEVIAKVPPVVEKADTSEFNADAYKVNKDATAEDLVSKLPGVTVQDGKVQARGEDVQRVLVDGKPFFGDDPSAVLRNVPAEIIEKIQVFDQQSEQAQFTGIDDGNSSKTLNIVTRVRVRVGTFGKLTGGYGNDDRYKGGGNLNIFNNEQRISVLGQINNVNEQNFSSDDLAGVMSGQGRGGGFGGGRRGGDGGPRGGQGMSRNPGGGGFTGGGAGGFSGGGNASDFLINSKGGLNTTKAFGINYQDKLFDKIDVNGSYFFNLTNNDAKSDVQREYFANSLGTQNYSENSTTNSKNINHRLNFRFDYQVDSLNSIMFRPRLTFQQNDGSSILSGATSIKDKMLNRTDNNSNSDYNAFNLTNELLLRHRFETRGRTISLELNSTYKKTDGNGDFFSENQYFNNLITSDTLDQFSNLDKKGISGSANVVYTEPVSENGLLQFNSSLSYSEDKSDQKTFSNSDSLQFSPSLLTDLSSVYKKIYRTQSYGTGYRYQKEGLSLMLGVNYNISALENNASYPYTFKLERTFYSILPSFMFRYGASRDQNFHLMYRASNTDPSVDQLQNVINNSNPVQLSTGNPELKQDSRHNIMLRYSKLNFTNMNSFFVMLGGTITQNYIGNSTIIAYKDTVVRGGIPLKQGTQLTRPENMDGYVNLRSFFVYSLPVSFIMSNVNLNASASYSRTPGIINGATNYSNNAAYGAGLGIASNISRDIDFSLSSTSTFNNVKNTIRSDQNQSYFNQNSRAKLFWNIWEGFLFQGELNHIYDNGLQSTYNRNSLLCNLAVGKKLFSSDQGEIRVTVYDVFNQNTNIQRNITDSYIEDTRTNVLGRYWLLTLTYNLRAF